MTFSIRETPRERRTASRACARQVLGMGPNRLALVLAGIACATVSFLSFFLPQIGVSAVYQWLGKSMDEMSFGAWCLLQLLTLFLFWILAMPLWLGMYRMAIDMMDGRANGKAFFHYAEGVRGYGRALAISARLIPRWLPAMVGYLVMITFFDLDLVGLLVVVAFAITLVLSVLWAGGLGGFVTLAVTNDEAPLYRIKKQSLRLLEGERIGDFCFHFGMVWRVLVSLAFAGLPLLLHTLPHAMLSSVCYVRRLSARDGVDF